MYIIIIQSSITYLRIQIQFIIHFDKFAVYIPNRYLSRCLLIEFKHPRIKSTITEFDQLYAAMNILSSAIGFLIGLGKKLTQSSNKDIDEVIMPKLDLIFGDQVFPRVALSYGILLWFTLQVIIKACPL